MEAIQVKAVQLGTMTEGTSQRGAWMKQELIVQTLEQYPKTICVSVWNDTAKFVRSSVTQGATISIKLEISSREFNGKWYTEVTGRDVQILAGAQPRQQAPAPTPPQMPSEPDWGAGSEEDDDLPF
jgi:single-stranded DNA-binding protein